MTTALVLGAGGSVGFAYHVGTLAGLAETGWDPCTADLIVGTSSGAIMAALLRAEVSPADLYCGLMGRPLSALGREILAEGQHLLTLMAHMRRGQPRAGRPASPRLLAELARHPRRIRPGLFLAASRPAGSVSTETIAAVFRSAYERCRSLSLPSTTVDSTHTVSGNDLWPSRPLWLCTVDFDSGQRAVLGQDSAPPTDVGTAVAASAAVPSFFEPVVINGRRFVDGGLHSPVNADVLAGTAVDRVVVSAPMGMAATPSRLGIDLPGRALNHYTAQRELSPRRRAGAEIQLFEPGPHELALMHYDAFELDHLPEIATRARQTVIDGIGALRLAEPAG